MINFSSPYTLIPIIFLVLVAIFISILYKDAKLNIREDTKNLPFYDQIYLSIEYIIQNMTETGRFIYQNHINAEIEYDNVTYNSLRHAGVLYSLYLYEKLGLEYKYKENRILSSKYFIDRYIEKMDDEKYYVISRPEEESIKVKIAKTGAAGIALCALTNLYSEEIVSLEMLKGLGEFILSMQNPDGGVYAYYDIDNKLINKEAEAIFYSSEAAAGLIYLYEIDNQEKWLLTSKKIILNLAKTRKPLDLDIPFDNWALLVVEKLFALKCELSQEEKGIIISFIEQMAISVLSRQITNTNNSYCGAFTDNIRPGSLGTIMEGLSSIYNCTDSSNLKKIIYKALWIGCVFLAKVQVKTGIHAGGFPNSANWVRTDVTPNAKIIRIDNVQHVITAWLKFQQILKVTKDY